MSIMITVKTAVENQHAYLLLFGGNEFVKMSKNESS